MTATEKLRALLDERGVEYTTHDDMGARETSWNGFTAYQLTPESKLIMHPTPEQAVAATLGETPTPPPPTMPEHPPLPLCEAIRHMVKASGKSMRAISLELGKSPGWLAQLVWHEKDVRVSTLHSIAGACGYEVRLVSAEESLVVKP